MERSGRLSREKKKTAFQSGDKEAYNNDRARQSWHQRVKQERSAETGERNHHQENKLSLERKEAVCPSFKSASNSTHSVIPAT